MTEMGVFVELFGVDMELLGFDCSLTFEEYHAFYRDNYSAWAAEHVKRMGGTHLMEYVRCIEESFAVVGKEGATTDGEGFIQKLWEEGFTKGLYLAGVECNDEVEAPDGWIKWIIPGYEYIYAECKDENTFAKVVEYMKQNEISLAGAVHDFTCPETGKNYMFFPVKML